MSAPRRSPPTSQQGTGPAAPERQPSSGGARKSGPLAAGLLGAGVVALVVLLAWLGAGGGAGRTGRVPITAAAMTATAGAAAPTGPIVEATEVTATPSRGEPTDVVPTGSASATEGLGTAVPEATAAPTQPPPTATAAPAAVQITCADAQNSVSGEVCVHTTPGAALTITVTYCSGQKAGNVDLQGTSYADSDGNYIWTWVPETTCPGTAVAHVSASGAGGSSDATAPFQVQP